MRKGKPGRKLKRPKSQKEALLRELISQLFEKGRIKTTQAKAKEIRGKAEKFLTQAKKGDLTERRKLLRYFPKKVVKKLIEEIAPKYQNRAGGYTRIVKMGPRKSDGAKMAIIELV